MDERQNTNSRLNGMKDILEHTNFTDLGLSSKVLDAVAATGYTTPTPIQAGAIPHVLNRRDVLGLAQTGTGKTASFVLPMLTLLERGRARARLPRTLILEPTRELAAQVAENFDRYGVNQKLTVALLIGGVSFDDQDRKLQRGADVLIATPGRLLDHVERGKLLLQGVEILVIDEADRMLDMGFIPDIERICKLIPLTRQTLFFSATMPPEITRLTEAFLTNPARIEVTPPASTAATVTQKLSGCGTADAERRAKLRQLLRGADNLQNAIIFCNRKREVQVVYRSLQRHGFSVGALHGDMDQRARMATLDSFRSNAIQLLVASDVAARGLDIPAVSHVFNYNVPTHAEDYVHRIGRTGRAGRSGTAISLVAPSDEKYLTAIEDLIDRSIDWMDNRAAPQKDDKTPLDRQSDGRVRRRERKTEPAAATNGAAAAPKKSETAVNNKTTTALKNAGERGTGENRRRGERAANDRRRGGEPHDGRGRSYRQDDEPSVQFGKSEYVPAFLLRPPRRSRRAS